MQLAVSSTVAPRGAEKWLSVVVLLILFTGVANGQVNVTKIDSSKLPKQIKYLGHISNAVTWKDGQGVHYVLTTETGEYKSKDEDGEKVKNAELYAYHFVSKGDSIKQLWRIYDYSKDCDVDVSVAVIKKAFRVTDLNKNGVAEVWVMYENQCTGDVSPAPTKIIMYEGNKKYAIRGEGGLRVVGKDYAKGQYTMDESFKNGNALFRQFAVNLWAKYNLKNL